MLAILWSWCSMDKRNNCGHIWPWYIEVNLSGLLTSWRRHVDQLKRCFDNVTIPNNTQEPTDHEDISEGEENTSGVTEVWANLSPLEQSPTQANKDTCTLR